MLPLVLGVAVLLGACASPGTLGAPATTSFVPTACYAKPTTDVLCARQAEVGYGTEPGRLMSVAPGAGAVTLAGIRYLEAKGKGSLDVSLGGDAICTANALTDSQPTGLWTRTPDGALMTLLMGRAICTITGNRTVVIGGRATLRPDGSVEIRDPLAQVSSAPGVKAQFIVDLPERSDLVTVHASSSLKFARTGGAETSAQKSELVSFLRTGTGFDKTTRTISAFDASVIDKQSDFVQ